MPVLVNEAERRVTQGPGVQHSTRHNSDLGRRGPNPGYLQFGGTMLPLPPPSPIQHPADLTLYIYSHIYMYIYSQLLQVYVYMLARSFSSFGMNSTSPPLAVPSIFSLRLSCDLTLVIGLVDQRKSTDTS